MSWWRPYPELKEVIVNLRSGTAFRGVVWQRRDGWLILRQAYLIQDRDQPAGRDVDGEVLVRVGDIDFIQVVV